MATMIIFRNGKRAPINTWRDEPGALDTALAEYKANTLERKALNRLVLEAKVERLASTL